DTLVLKNLTTASSPLFSDIAGHQTIVVDGGAFAFNADIADNTAAVTLSVIDAAGVSLGATQHLGALSIAGSSRVTLPSGGRRVLDVAGALAISTDGHLDLPGNRLV